MTYIEEIRIVRFAGLRDRTLTLSCGVNLIIGGNESGKSTTEAFLTFLFYGFADKNERTRWMPLDGGSCEGSCIVVCDGLKYRVERRAAPGGNERLAVIDLASRAPIPEITKPGDFFFGVPRDIFTGTARISQSDVSTLDTRMGEAVDNMLFSADEHVNVPRALKKLDDVRTSLWYKNKKGGRIYENERRLEELRERFEAASEKQAGIIDTEGRLADTLEQKEATEQKLAVLAVRIRTGELLQCRAKQAEVEKWKRERADSRTRVEAILSEFPEGDGRIRPDRSFLERVRGERMKIDGLERDRRAVEDRLHAIMNGTDRQAAAKAKFPDLVRDVGGTLKVSEHVTALSEREKKAGRLAKLLLIAAAVLLLAGALLLILPRTPLLLGLGIGGLVLGAGLLAFSIREFLLSRRAGKEEADFIASFGADSREELIRWMDRISQSGQQQTDLSPAEQLRLDRSELFEAADEHREILDGLCRSVGCASAEETEKRVADFLERMNGATADYNRLDALITSTEEMLRDDVERFEGKEPEVELPKNFDLKEARRAEEFEKKRLSVLTERLHSLELKRTELRATAEPSAPLYDRVIETEKQLEKDRESFAAYELARDALSGASDDLRKMISPLLSSKASENMKFFSDGKYDSLGVSSDFGLSFDTLTENGGKMSADSVYMSQATRDGAYLSLRVALLDLVCRGSDKRPPFLFDEALVFFDEARLRAALRLLSSLSPRIQTVLFSSSDREKRALEETDATVIYL